MLYKLTPRPGAVTPIGIGTGVGFWADSVAQNSRTANRIPYGGTGWSSGGDRPSPFEVCHASLMHGNLTEDTQQSSGPPRRLLPSGGRGERDTDRVWRGPGDRRLCVGLRLTLFLQELLDDPLRGFHVPRVVRPFHQLDVPVIQAVHNLFRRDPAEVLELDGANHRSEEHTSELQSRQYLVCRLLLEK